MKTKRKWTKPRTSFSKSVFGTKLPYKEYYTYIYIYYYIYIESQTKRADI